MCESIVLQTVFTRGLDQNVRQEVLTLCAAAFGEPFDALFSLLPPDGLHVLARLQSPKDSDNGQLVGHAVATPRIFCVDGGEPVRAAYVDAVATLPGVQGSGVGSRVMRRLMDEASKDYRIGGLNTFIPDWYGRMGWDEWLGTYALDEDGEITPSYPEGHVMIYRFAHSPQLNRSGRLVATWRPGGGW